MSALDSLSNRERIAWGALFAFTIVTRLWDLGSRAMSHDEAQHAWFSYLYFRDGVFSHTPMLHGPLLFHLNAAIYWLLGADDATARLMPALAGIAMIPALLLYRPWLGRIGAFCAGVLVAISPSFLFYGRYLRNEIYIALLALIWIHCVLSFLSSRQPRWLAGVTLAMALSFAAKEVTFIFGAILGVFLVGLGLGVRRGGERNRERRTPALELAAAHLGLVLPFLSPMIYPLAGWDAKAWTAPADVGRAICVGAVLALAGWAGGRLILRRDLHRTWTGCFLAFWALLLTLFTSLWTNSSGVASGIVGSLGYWLGEHPVGRGGQPAYYYAMLAGIYETLAMALSTVATFVLVRRLADPAWSPLASAELPPPGPGAFTRPDPAAVRALYVFLPWWLVASFVAYTVAGEKMPWLLVHIALPACLMGGWAMARPIRAWRERRMPSSGSVLATLVAAAMWVALLRVAGVLLLGTPGSSARDTARLAGEVIVFAALLGAMFWLGRRAGSRAAGAAALLGLLGVSALWTVRTGLRAAFLHGDLANEPLVYAHGTPDIQRALREIDLLSHRVAGDRSLAIARDHETTWPFAWYLRDYPNAAIFDVPPEERSLRAPVLLVGEANRSAAWPFTEGRYTERVYRQIWWAPEGYRELGSEHLIALIRDRHARRKFWRFLAHREYEGLDARTWPQRKEFSLYIRHDVGTALWHDVALAFEDSAVPGADPASQPAAPLRRSPLVLRRVLRGEMAGAALSSPTALEFSHDGRLLIADSGNHRILILRPDFSLERAVGSRCALSAPLPNGCLGTRGDGQFNEPWGVAWLAGDGFAVADTWNGRVQWFDAEGRHVRTAPEGGLWGPRGLLGLASGELLVADTGNKRLLRLDAEGREVATDLVAYGLIGPLDEPVGLALTASGSVLVADTWNRRIVSLGRDLEPLAGTLPASFWRSRGKYDKPFLAADRDGSVWVTDPAGRRLLRVGADGRILEAWWPTGAEGEAPLERPVGIALHPEQRMLAVADHQRGEILLFEVDCEGDCAASGEWSEATEGEG